MRVFADSSFLVAAFTPSDDHNRKAWRWWQNNEATLLISSLAYFEAENVIRRIGVNHEELRPEMSEGLIGLKMAVAQGLISCQHLPTRRLIPQASRLSSHHTVKQTFGAMDILHVAAAQLLQADTFLTFDDRQGMLAQAEGMKLF